MNKFRKKPVVIEAVQWDGTAEVQAQIVTWANGAISGWFGEVYFLEVHTLEGTLRAHAGDWIIQGIKGEFYPCRQDIFEATYEPVIGLPAGGDV